MKKALQFMINKFLNKQLGLRVRLFNILAMAGILVSSGVGTLALITDAGAEAAPICYLSTLLAIGLLYYSYRSGRYQLCYMITVIAVFLVVFPIVFITGGGFRGSMPMYFIFAVIFTAFMLDGKKMFVMAGIELFVYTGLCLFSYFFPQYIIWYKAEWNIVIDIIVGLIVVSVSLGATMYLQFRLYDEQHRELEKARKQLAEENIALEQINRLKTEFLGNVSHELKTPLTVMSGYAQTTKQLAGNPDTPEGSEVSRRMTLISSEAERLALMVGQVLDVTRMEEGRMVMEPVRCYVDEIIHAAVETHYPILNKNQNRLDIRIESGLPAVHADPVRISQVIVNLISNAVRFTANGLITVSARREGPHILVCVSDTGVGIAAERLPHIFERYSTNNEWQAPSLMLKQRVARSANHSYVQQKSGGGQDTGTGLGLYICKHIVEQHGGTIWIKSEEGHGTDLFFTLPVL